MTRDTLYLLPPGFASRGERQFCPECAEIWGVLAYYPAIKESLDVVYQPVEPPRPALVKRLGEGRWNCPTLVRGDTGDAIDNARDIARYWAERFGTALPR